MRSRIPWCVLYVVASLTVITQATLNTSVPAYIESVLDDPSSYNRKERPLFNTGDADLVDLNIYVHSISSLSETDMDYFVSVFLRQEWYDRRLAINDTSVNESVYLHYDILDKLWLPDTFIANEKSSGDLHDITTPNILIKLSPEGLILLSQRISTRVSCQMQLEDYPMDQQTCSMQFEIYGRTTDHLKLRWKRAKDAVQINQKLKMAEFVIVDHSTGDCTQFYSTGSFSCIKVDFVLQRLLSYFVVQVYTPSILVVVLSWVSFWIDLYAVPARISVGLLTVVTISTQSSGINAKLPRVSYFKAIDVWLVTCYLFIFGAFLEYAIVNVLSRHDPIDKIMPKTPDANKQKKNPEEKLDPFSEQNSNKSDTVLPLSIKPAKGEHEQTEQPNGETGKRLWRKAKVSMNLRIAVSPARSLRVRFANWRLRMRNNRALMVDHLCRVFFPAGFLLFNIIYWSYYGEQALLS